MNLVILTPQDFIDARTAQLRGPRFAHITGVHRASVGDTLRVGMLDGLMGEARIAAIDTAHLTIDIPILDIPPPAKLPLTLILALPRPKMLRRILRSVTELGVERLVIINSYRVEKSFWHSPALQADAMRAGLIDGLQQARDTHLPEVQCRRLFKPFVEDELPAIALGKQGLVAHPQDGAGSARLHTPTVLAIGPEGGFIAYEVDRLIAAGLQTMSFGPRILRVENAIAYAVGHLFG